MQRDCFWPIWLPYCFLNFLKGFKVGFHCPSLHKKELMLQECTLGPANRGWGQCLQSGLLNKKARKCSFSSSHCPIVETLLPNHRCHHQHFIYHCLEYLNLTSMLWSITLCLYSCEISSFRNLSVPLATKLQSMKFP